MMRMLDFQWVPESWRHYRFLRGRDCCGHGREGEEEAPPVALWLHPPGQSQASLTKNPGGEERGGNPSAYYVALHCVCFLQFVSAESSVQSCCCWSVFAFLSVVSVVVVWLVGWFVCFFAVFELVASAFRRAASGAPSRAAHFDLLVL